MLIVTMKTSLLFLAISLIATGAYASSGEPVATPLVGGVLMRDGIVYPAYSTVGAGLTYDTFKKAFVAPTTDPIPVYDANGFDSNGVNKDTGTAYDPNGYDVNGYNQEGYDQNGFYPDGTNKDTGTAYDNNGYTKTGFDANGINRDTGTSFGLNGLNVAGLTSTSADIVAGLPDLRASLADYANAIAALSAFAVGGAPDANGIKAAIGNELAAAISASDAAALAAANWANADLSGALLNNPHLLQGKDLSTLNGGLTVADLQSLQNNVLGGTTLPAMDLTGWEPTDNQLNGVDLSLTTGLKGTALTHIRDGGLNQVRLPSGFDMSGWNPVGFQVYQADLSNTTGLTAASLIGVANSGLYACILPPGLTRAMLTAAGLSDVQIMAVSEYGEPPSNG